MFIIEFNNGGRFEEYAQWIEAVYYTSYKQAENELFQRGFKLITSSNGEKWLERGEGIELIFADVLELIPYKENL